MTATLAVANSGPTSPEEVEAMFNNAWAQAHMHSGRRKSDAEERREPLELTPSMKFCFRTRPGGPRRPIVRINWKEDDWGLDNQTKEDKAKARLLYLWEKRNANESPEWLATMEQAVADNRGQREIVFTSIDSNVESWYQTDSEAIAAVVRRYMRSDDPNARFFYEVFPGREILVGDRRFPDSPDGTQAALAFMAESGGDLKYVHKGTKKPFKAVE
jgi:hypothetical protein